MDKFYFRFTQDKKISCDNICSIVQKIISTNSDLDNKVLVFELKSIIDQDDNDRIPKLTFKN